MSREYPTLDFTHLTLRDEDEEEGMPPVTRSQTSSARLAASRRLQQSSMSRRSQQMSSRESRSRLVPGGDRTRGTPSSSNSPPDTIQVSNRTRVRYNNTQFDSRARAVAKAAFECDDLEMVRYFEDEEPDNDYHFEIMERIVVTVPRPRHGLLPRCTCTHPTSRGLCKHLWWLLDHVAFEFTRARATGNEDVEVSFTGEAASLQRRNTVDRQTVHSILEERIDDIVRRHSWVEYDSDDEEVRQSQTVGLFSLVETQGLLPTEFAALDPADNSQPVPSRLLRSYVTTVLARAASDPRIHQRVKTLLGAYYDNVVLQKLRTRVRVIFDDYDLMRAGHAVDVHNVADCASRLWDASSSVSGLLRNRAGNIRPSPALRHALAGFLLDILVGVLEKRGDAHTGFRPPFLEAVARQDIFHYTIVQPPARTPAFVVSVLDQFVHVLDATLLERIEHIAVDLEQTPTPLTYISRLRSIASNALTRQRQGGDAA